MPTPRFQFALQPALDKALAQKEQCELALADARRQLAAEEQKLAEIRDRLARTRQQIAAEYDKSMEDARGGASGALMAGRRAYIAELRTREQRQREAAAEQEKQVDWARQKVELRRQELADALRQVDALEKYKEKAEKEFKADLAKKEENEADDIRISRWKP